MPDGDLWFEAASSIHSVDLEEYAAVPSTRLGEEEQEQRGDEGGRAGGVVDAGLASRLEEVGRRGVVAMVITSAQSATLHDLLAQSTFPSTMQREEMGVRLGLSPQVVETWLQNERQMQKGRARELIKDFSVPEPLPPRRSSHPSRPASPTSPNLSSTSIPSLPSLRPVRPLSFASSSPLPEPRSSSHLSSTPSSFRTHSSASTSSLPSPSITLTSLSYTSHRTSHRTSTPLSPPQSIFAHPLPRPRPLSDLLSNPIARLLRRGRPTVVKKKGSSLDIFEAALVGSRAVGGRMERAGGAVRGG